jgi:UTP:GlnB (protein PII) uridylyltransferase
MRWQQLFADLDAQFAEAEAAADRAESASRARAEIGAVRLAERLAGAVGHSVELRCRGVGQLVGVLAEVGGDWLLVEEEAGREALVATAAVLSVGGLGRQTAAPEAAGIVRARLDLRRAVRALARDRSVVHVVLDDGATLVGTIDRVGEDFFEVAVHAPDQPRRHAAVRAVQAAVISAVAVIRTAPLGLD